MEFVSRSIQLPTQLNDNTKQLVISFANELARKLRSAEEKYGYTDGWRDDEWTKEECMEDFLNHVDKGDPRDVAIYCAFMWARGWDTGE